MTYVMALLTLTIMAGLSIFTVLIYSLWKHPPIITLPALKIDVSLKDVPSEFLVVNQVATPVKDTTKAADQDDLIPVDIVEYCDQESDSFTREMRKRYARTLKNELGTWELALQRLQQEDGYEEKPVRE